MSAYGPLAQWYDSLTADVPYAELAVFYESILKKEGREHLTLLDLCCGTGTLTLLLAARGHELIGVDCAPEMLSVAADKASKAALAAAPLLLCQEAAGHEQTHQKRTLRPDVRGDSGAEGH